MSIVYLLALAAFCMVLFGVLFEGVVSVSRKPVWGRGARMLSLVETEDRRDHQLPFVGQDRRQAEIHKQSQVDAEEASEVVAKGPGLRRVA